MKANLFVSIAIVLTSGLLASAFGQGALTPPGPPGPTMKTLEQIEPRTPISSLPYIISASGSYYVTTNLTGVSGTNGITITANNVTLDLGGFTLTGAPGSINGVSVAGNSDVTVKNGSLTAWGAAGIDADSCQGGQFRNLNISSNGTDGLDPGQASQIFNCTAVENGGNGFGGFCSDAIFEQCTANGNIGYGFSTFEGTSILKCSASLNGYDGIVCFVDCTVRDSVARNNGGTGINFPYGYANGTGGLVAGCVSDGNDIYGIATTDGYTIKDCTADGNTSDGINTGSGSVIESSSVAENQGNGITMGNNCAISGCTSLTNSSGSNVGIFTGNACSVENCVAAGNSLNGIVVSNACLLEHNICEANGSGNLTDGGILCKGNETRIEGNHLTDNRGNGLYLAATNNTVVCNSAKGNTINYSVGTGNDIGPIGSAATSTSPWANLQ